MLTVHSRCNCPLKVSLLRDYTFSKENRMDKHDLLKGYGLLKELLDGGSKFESSKLHTCSIKIVEIIGRDHSLKIEPQLAHLSEFRAPSNLQKKFILRN